MPGISDEAFTRFLELCEVLHISPMASEALGEMFYEVYYEGYDNGFKAGLLKGDLKRGIQEWADSLGRIPLS